MAEALTITELAGFRLVSVLARKNVAAADIGAALGIPLRAEAGWGGTPDHMLLGTGPGTWLAFERQPDSDWRDDIEHRLAGKASIVDQSGAYAIFRIAGSDARRLLQRGLFIDLDPASIAPGWAANSSIAHVGVLVWQSEADVFHVAPFRSFAASFRHWLEISCPAL